MEAPEKLYCMHRLSGDYSCSTTPFAGGDEYTRTDAFIEKACKYLQKEVLDDYPGVVWEGLIKEFKDYMKGE